MVNLASVIASHSTINRVFVHAQGSTEPGFFSADATLPATSLLCSFVIAISDDQAADDWQFTVISDVDVTDDNELGGKYIKIIKRSDTTNCDIFVGLSDDFSSSLENRLVISGEFVDRYHLVSIYFDPEGANYITVDGVGFHAVTSSRTAEPVITGLRLFWDKNGTAPTIRISNFICTPVGNRYTWTNTDLEWTWWRQIVLDQLPRHISRDLYDVTGLFGDISSKKNDGELQTNFGYYVSGMLTDDLEGGWLINEVDTLPNRNQVLFTKSDGLTFEESIPRLILVNVGPIGPAGNTFTDGLATLETVPFFEEYDPESDPQANIYGSTLLLGSHNGGILVDGLAVTNAVRADSIQGEKDLDGSGFYRNHNIFRRTYAENTVQNVVPISISDEAITGTTYHTLLEIPILYDTTLGPSSTPPKTLSYIEIDITTSRANTDVVIGRARVDFATCYVSGNKFETDNRPDAPPYMRAMLLVNLLATSGNDLCFVTLIPQSMTYDIKLFL